MGGKVGDRSARIEYRWFRIVRACESCGTTSLASYGEIGERDGEIYIDFVFCILIGGGLRG